MTVVSIIVNNYNYAGYVAEAIDSALAQTWPDVEVIVVDDGSTDDSRRVIAGYGDRVRAVFKANGGQGSAFNAGFAVSRGDIVLFLDADDRLYPQAAERVVAAWRPGLANLAFLLALTDGQGRQIDRYPPAERPLSRGDVRPRLLTTGRYSSTVTSGNAYARAALQAVLPVPEARFRLSADGYLVTVIPFHGEIAVIDDEPLGIYRQHGNNLWAASAKQVPAGMFAKSVRHDFDKYHHLREAAAAAGLRLDHELGSRDELHLMSRLASRRLDPAAHPIAGDSPLRLAWRGVIAARRHSELPPRRQWLLAAWFVWVGVMPRRLARPAVHWLFASHTRPAAVDWAFKRLRAAAAKPATAR